MREKDGFREQLGSIIEQFPDREWLTLKDCMGYLGMSRNTFVKRFPDIAKNGGATRTKLALALI